MSTLPTTQDFKNPTSITSTVSSSTIITTTATANANTRHPTAQPNLLSHTSLNPSPTNPTLLLIHGAFSSRSDFRHISTHLPSRYHLLLPDLPGHAESRFHSPLDGPPFSVPAAADALAALIRAKASNGVAHVVGFSLGAKIAVVLATRYPDLVSTLFISGFHASSPTPPPRFIAAMTPYAVWLDLRLEDLIPRRWVRRAMDGADIRRGDRSYATLGLCKAICAQGSQVEEPWEARTLVVVAGKRDWWLPTEDSVVDARALVEVGKKGNEATKAVTHPEMRHPWCLQDPSLFAKAVVTWIEDGRIVEGFVEI